MPAKGRGKPVLLRKRPQFNMWRRQKKPVTSARANRGKMKEKGKIPREDSGPVACGREDVGKG